MDREDLHHIADSMLPGPHRSGRFVTHDELHKTIDERLDARVSKLMNRVTIIGITVIMSILTGAWTVTVELRDAVQLADESDECLDARGRWMQRQEQHDREQDAILRRLDPTYIPPTYRELPE